MYQGLITRAHAVELHPRNKQQSLASAVYDVCYLQLETDLTLVKRLSKVLRIALKNNMA